MNRTFKRRDFLKAVGLGTAALSFSSCGMFRRRPPNFVIIFTDDQGYADVGCYGAEGFETSNLDRMADEGMRFTSFYVAQAVCSASRAGLLTGCYPNRIGILGALNPQSVTGISATEETIAEVLKKKDYACGIFGKWHLGYQREFLPLQHGFDEYLGLPYSNDMWPIGYDGRPAPKDSYKGKLPFPPIIDGNTKVAEIRSLEDQDMLTMRYTERAVRFIEKNKDRPFFLYVPHSMPHVPLGVSNKFRGRSAQGIYGDVIMEIDWSVGKILETLEKHGLEKSTLVMFTSDNGPWLNFGNHAGSVGPLREGKGTAFEGGVRVPCIMRWSGRIPAGTVCDNLATTLDILPTIAEIAEAPQPPNTIDGVSLLPLLEGDMSANPREHFFYYYGKQLRAVRHRKWKLILPHESRSYEGVEPGMDGLGGPYARIQTGYELYDLENNISEQNNLVELYPEVVEQLMALAELARQELGDADVEGRGCRPPGRISAD